MHHCFYHWFSIKGDPAPRGRDTGVRCLGTSVVVTTRWRVTGGGGAPGIEWVGPDMLQKIPQCPGQPPTDNDPALMSAVLRGRPGLREPKDLPPKSTSLLWKAPAQTAHSGPLL